MSQAKEGVQRSGRQGMPGRQSARFFYPLVNPIGGLDIQIGVFRLPPGRPGKDRQHRMGEGPVSSFP